MGISCVAIYSEVDRDLDFVKMADESVEIGPAEATVSYLNVPRIIEVCYQYGVDAVHPGYGFLSENANFAQALQGAGIRFIGPRPEAIRTMGSKSQAKALAEVLGVPIIPGYRGRDQSLDVLLEQAQQIGFPLLIKATHGGGGKGMRRVESPLDFEMDLVACQREAQAAFSNGDMMLEKYISQPRHIEVQIFGDQHGNIITLSDRDCSLQRRHQKIIEEAPAADVPEDLRACLHRDAVALAKAVQYEGAGTVEFLVDKEGKAYFLEMNTRLQVEHPVTEAVLGIDLVEWQIRVAQGEVLPVQESPKPQGHAVEARLYAEDPENHFFPSSGILKTFQISHGGFLGEGIRLDSGFKSGNRVTVYYDPLLAKLISHGDNRQSAYYKLSEALSTLVVEGVKTNRDLLLRLCHLPEIVHQLPDIGFLDRRLEAILRQPLPGLEESVLLGLGLLLYVSRFEAVSTSLLSPWDVPNDWRGCDLIETTLAFQFIFPGEGRGMNAGDAIHTLSRYGQTWFLDGQVIAVDKTWVETINGKDSIGCRLNGKDIRARRVPPSSSDAGIALWKDGHIYEAKVLDWDPQSDELSIDDSHLNAPMPGRVISILVAEGQTVEAGTPLIVLEAMKMEHTIRAPYQGVVTALSFSVGDFVEEGAKTVVLKALL
jgi:3-methylcrotonyl-CoA carboxylase alpha subunit